MGSVPRGKPRGTPVGVPVAQADHDEYPLRKPITQEQIDTQTLKYKLALQRLKAAIPEDMVSPEDRVLAFETLEPRAWPMNAIACRVPMASDG